MLLLNIDFVASGNAPEDYYDYACRKTTELEEHDPPILYDLWLDPGEADPLDSHATCIVNIQNPCMTQHANMHGKRPKSLHVTC